MSLDKEALKERVIEVLKDVYDPEIPVNIYELGLVYDVEVDDDAKVGIRMTLTSPMCPVAGSLPIEIETRLMLLPGVSTATVYLVWEPPWTPEKMSEAARLELGFF
jgi:FeS assembly SUF system protein